MGLTEFETHLEDAFKNLIRPFDRNQFLKVKVFFSISLLLNVLACFVDNIMFIVYAVFFGQQESVDPLFMLILSIAMMSTGVLSLFWCVKTFFFELRWLRKQIKNTE
jgi:hypothetical protein